MRNNILGTEILEIIDILSSEKNISKSIICMAIEDAFKDAIAGQYSQKYNIVSKMNPESGDIMFFDRKNIVENPSDLFEISQANIKKYVDAIVHDDYILIPINAPEMKRVSVGMIKNSLLDKIKNAEREVEYNDFIKKEGTIVTGIVKKISYFGMIVAINNKTEAIIFKEGLLKGDNYNVGDKIKAYIKSVQRKDVECQVILSRTDNNFLGLLLKDAVFEIQDGLIEIKVIARDMGSKAKVAIYSHDPRLDGLGICIGHKGMRIKGVIEELNGEKVDIIYWDRDIVQFAKNAIIPAKAISAQYIKLRNTIEVVIKDEELKLAIGRNGQNVRLASQVLGINITAICETDKKNETAKQMQKMKDYMTESLDIDASVAQFLISSGITSPFDLLNFGHDKLIQTGVFTEDVSEELILRAKTYVNKVEAEQKSEKNTMGINYSADDVADMSHEIMVNLAKNGNIKTLEEIADLDILEFIEYAELSSLDKFLASKIIMDARKIAYGIG